MEEMGSRGQANALACVAVATVPCQAAVSGGRRKQLCSGTEGRASPKQFGVWTEGWRDGGLQTGHRCYRLTGSSMKTKFSTSRRVFMTSELLPRLQQSRTTQN